MGHTTKVDIFSGFLGAGKTTLIRKLIREAYGNEQIVLIENEFGEIGVDRSFLQDTGVQINEMTAGCICCTLVGDFGKALEEVIAQYAPDRILIEPSGVGKLSDVIIAVQDLHNEHIALNGFTTVIDAKKCRMYMENFGEFYENQVEHASSLILSHTKGLSQEQLDDCLARLRAINAEASIVTTDWDEIDGKQILEIMERKRTLSAELEHLREEAYREQAEHEAEHHHHDHEHEHHHHEKDEDGHEHHHHHAHDEDGHHDHHDDEHEHHHHHHHHEHGHHHADEVFDEFGVETAHHFTEMQLKNALDGLADREACGFVLRAKGVVEGEDTWYEFDYVPGEPEIRRRTAAEATGMLCVIGAGLKQDHIKELFGL